MKVAMLAHDIRLPALMFIQLHDYLNHAFLQLRQLTDGSYKLNAHIRGLGGGNTGLNTGNRFYKKLYKAVTSGHVNEVRYLLNNIDTLDEHGDFNVNAEHRKTKLTLLMAASRSPDYVTIMGLLVDAGADINGRNSEGNTVLMYACSGFGDTVPLIEYIVDKGADVNLVNLKSENALHFACQHGYYNIVSHLIHKVQDVDAISSEVRLVLHWPV